MRPVKRFRFLRILFRIVGILIASLLFLSFFAAHVSPAVFWPFAFLGLIQPVLFVLNLLFLGTWSFRKKKILLFPAVAFLFSVSGTMREFNLLKGGKAPSGAFSIMSFNVKVFDLYNWSHNVETRNNMFKLIRKEDPAILCIQEFFHRDSSKYSNLDSLLRSPGYNYYHVVYTTTLRKDDHWGVVTFSKYPIVNKGEIVFNNRVNNTCIYTDLLIGKDTVRVYNMHLQSIAFNKDDHKFMESMTTLSTEEEIAGSMNLLRRLKRAYVKRANQAESVRDHISRCHYPVIVVGDLNDTPVSYTYNVIASGLDDAFLDCGRGLGKTFVNGTPFPRIDYIFHDEHFESAEFTTLNARDLSDHYPVFCKLYFRK